MKDEIPRRLRARASGLEDLVQVSVVLGYHEAAEVLRAKARELIQEAEALEKALQGSNLFSSRCRSRNDH
jgi:hypothetical protein